MMIYRSIILGFLLLMLPLAALTKDLEKVTVQLDWIYQFEFAGFIAAIEKGFYAEAGLEVELQEYQAGIDTLQQVNHGKANYGIHNSSLVIENGQPANVVMLATYLQRSPLVFVTHPSISRPADLIGKRIMGTTDELRYSSLALMMSHFYINSSNSRIIEHTFSIEDFVEGKVDAMSAFRSNQLFELDQLGVEYNIIDPADYGFFMSAVNIFTSYREAVEFPQRTARFIKASNRGWQYALENQAEIVDLILDKYSQLKSREALLYEAKVIEQMMLTDFFPVGQLADELGERAFKQLQQSKLIDQQVKYRPVDLHHLLEHRGENGELLLTDAQRRYLLEKQSLKLCVDPDWLPFEAIQDGRHVGIVADIFREMIQPHLPIPIILHQTNSWEETLQAARERHCDIVSLLSASPARSSYLSFTEPYITAPLVLATRVDKFFIDDITQVRDRPIGYVRGYSTASQIRQRLPDINLVAVDSARDGLRLVEEGELFGYVGNLMVIAQHIQKDFNRELKISARLQEQDVNAIGIRNDEPLLKSIFEQLVDNISHSDQQRQQIYNRWVSVKIESNQDYTLVLQVGLIMLAIIAVLTYISWREKAHNKALLSLSITDPLTQVYNRVRGDELLKQVHDNFVRYQQPAGLMMLYIDFFKMINDNYGHSTGDAVLNEFAALLKKHLRVTDNICRWGGEEFLVICPHLSRDDIAIVAEKLLQQIRKHKFIHGQPVTASIGAGALQKDESIDALLEHVDQALYQSKNTGRNRVTIH